MAAPSAAAIDDARRDQYLLRELRSRWQAVQPSAIRSASRPRPADSTSPHRRTFFASVTSTQHESSSCADVSRLAQVYCRTLRAQKTTASQARHRLFANLVKDTRDAIPSSYSCIERIRGMTDIQSRSFHDGKRVWLPRDFAFDPNGFTWTLNLERARTYIRSSSRLEE
jgi:hypothetical protein